MEARFVNACSTRGRTSLSKREALAPAKTASAETTVKDDAHVQSELSRPHV